MRVFLLLCCSVVLLTGCVDRRLLITTTPPGALVYLNDAEMGRTPMEVDFTYYGVYDVRVRREGYEPIVTNENIRAPLHDLPVIDFIALLIPTHKRTRIPLHYDLVPEDTDEDALLERARDLRGQFLHPDARDAGHAEDSSPPSP